MEWEVRNIEKKEKKQIITKYRLRLDQPAVYYTRTYPTAIYMTTFKARRRYDGALLIDHSSNPKKHFFLAKIRIFRIFRAFYWLSSVSGSKGMAKKR